MRFVRSIGSVNEATDVDSHLSPVCEVSVVTSDTDEAHGGVDPADFRTALTGGVGPFDALALALVPAALIGVFSLPESTRRSLAFVYTDPTPLTAFTAHFVHLDLEHLLANLAGYGLLAGIGYLVAAASRQRRLFFTAFVTFCLAFPFALSALNLAVPRDAIGFGFSGINMAFAGVLPVLLAVFACRRLATDESGYPADLPVRLLPAAFLLIVGWMATSALPIALDPPGLAGPFVTLFGALMAGLQLRSAGPPGCPPLRRVIRAAIGRIRDRPGDGDLFVVGVVLVLTYPLIGFPTDATADGRVINTYVHLLGFCLAFIGPYVLVVAGGFADPRTY